MSCVRLCQIGAILLMGNGVLFGKPADEKTKRQILEFEQKLLAFPREKIDERGPLAVEFFAKLKGAEAKVFAIGMIDDRNVQVLPPKAEVLVLGAMLQDPDLRVRVRAAKALGYIGKGSEHFDDLKKLLAEQSPSAKLTVLSTMGKSHDARFLPTMKPYLKNSDPKLRRATAFAMSEFPPDLVRGDLVALLHDPAVEVRGGCACDIARIGGKTVLPDIADLVYDDHAAVRLSAIQALAEQGDIHWAKFVAHLLKDEDPQVRGQAAMALGKLKAFDYAGDVVRLIQDKETGVRRTVSIAIQEYGDKSLAPKVIVLLDDKDGQVRQRAIKALWSLGAKAASNDIAAKITDSSVSVRREAVLALMKLGSSGHAPQIAQALEDSDPKVRLYAVTALGCFRAEAYLPRLKLLRDDPDSHIRDAARYAVSRIEHR